MATIAFACNRGQDSHELLIFAGSMVRAPLEEAMESYNAKSAVKLHATFGGSMTMLSQAQISRRGDIYISSASGFMDKGQELGLIDPQTRATIGHMFPVICVKKGNPQNIMQVWDLVNDNVKLGLADPETVAIGIYSERIFKSAKINPTPVLIAHSHESLASALLAGTVDVIIGWNVFPMLKPDKVTGIPINPSLYGTPSTLEAAAIVHSKNLDAAGAFVKFLAEGKGKQIFEKHGYAETIKTSQFSTGTGLP